MRQKSIPKKFSLYFALRNESLLCQIIPKLVHEGFTVNTVFRRSGVSQTSSHSLFATTPWSKYFFFLPWSEVLLDTLTVSRFAAFYATRSSITVFLSSHHWTHKYATWIQPTSYTLFFKNHFNIIVLSVPKYFELYLCFTFWQVNFSSASCEVCVRQSHLQWFY
jgi:hypothetical protein